MLDLFTIKDRVEDLEFTFAGETVKGKAYPYKVTPEYMAGLRALVQKADASADSNAAPAVKNTDARMIADIIPEWDVLNDGKPFPPTYENLIGAPMSFIAAAAYAILDLVGKLSQTSESKS